MIFSVLTRKQGKRQEGLARVPQPRPGFELLPQPVPVSLEHPPPPFSAPAPLTASGDTPLSPRRVHVSSSPKREVPWNRPVPSQLVDPPWAAPPHADSWGPAPQGKRGHVSSLLSLEATGRGEAGVWPRSSCPRIRLSFPRTQSAPHWALSPGHADTEPRAAAMQTSHVWKLPLSPSGLTFQGLKPRREASGGRKNTNTLTVDFQLPQLWEK